MFEEYLRLSKGKELFNDATRPKAYVIDDKIYNNIYIYGMMTMLNTLYKGKVIDKDIIEVFLNQDDELIRLAASYILSGKF